MDDHSPAQLEEISVGNDSSVPADGTALAIRGGALRVLGYACGVLVSLATAAVLVRHLGIAGFGRYVTVTSLIALVGGVTEAGIVVYGIRELISTDEHERPQLIGNLLAMRVALTLLGVACATLFAVAAGYREVLVLGALVAGAGLLVQVTADVLSITLQARLLLGRLTVAELARRALTLVLTVSLALAGAGLLAFLGASTAAGIAGLALIAWMVRSHVRLRPAFDLRVWRELLAETLPYAVALSIAAIYLYITVIIMSLLATATQTGLFATSFRVTQAALAVPGLLLTAVFPLMSRRGLRGAGPGGTLGRLFTVAVIFGVWMSLATALGAGFIIDVIAGSHGRGSIPVLRIQGLMFIVSFVFTTNALYLVSIRRYRPLIVAGSSALVLNIALALILIPSRGAQGGAIADVVTETLAAVGLTIAVMRSVPEHRISLSFVPALVLACAASAVVLLLPIGSLAQALGATVIYFGVLLLTRAIPEEIVDAARRLRARPLS